MAITRTLVYSDHHLPFEDVKVVEMVHNIAKDINVDRIIINGDLLDMYNINMHGPKHPDVIENLQHELDYGKEWLVNLRKMFPDTHIVYNAGNHLYRLDRFILKHAKPFWNIITPEKYFDLESLNIEFYPYNHKYQIEKTNCYVQHSPPSYASAKAALMKKMDQTVIYGCTHREEKACITGGSGNVHAAYFNGWLGSTDATPSHKEVFSYAKGHQQWQQAFCIVTVINEVDFIVNQHSIRNGRTVVDGFLYEA